MTLLWEPPQYDGGSSIKGYYIEKCSGYSSRWIKVNRDPIDVTTKTFTDLVEGSDYEYRVLAENEAGISKPSETTGVFKAKDPYEKPGKPGQPEVKAITKNSATITWQPPSSDGGAKITNYILEMHEVSEVKWKTVNRDLADTTFTVKGLKEGTEYEFRVTAENKAGQGLPSAPSAVAKYGTLSSLSLNKFDYPKEKLVPLWFAHLMSYYDDYLYNYHQP